MMHTCLYCYQWLECETVGAKTVSKEKALIKYCRKRYKEIESDTRPCRRFRPALIFHCDKLNCRKHIQACLYGHAYSRHGAHPSLYIECEKCRQYDLVIGPMTKKFNIICEKQVVNLPRRKPPKDFRLPRRDKKKNGMPKDFVLPRRKSHPKKKSPSKLPKRRKKKPDGVNSKLPRRRDKKPSKLPRRRRNG